jgi:glutamyl-tRNA reductase
VGDDAGWTSLADGAAARVAALTERLPAPRVLVAGTGPMGTRAAHTLRERLGERLALTLAGRTPERLQAYAVALQARPVQLAALPEAFAWADAAIVGLRTRTALIDVQTVRPRPETRPLTIVDLSLPRAVHPDVARLPGVTLQDVDGITRGEGAHSRWRPEDRVRVVRLVEDAVHSYSVRIDPSDAAATLTTLRLRAEAVRRAQLNRTLARLPDLDAESRYAVEAMTRAIVNRLLHDTTMRLRAGENGDVAEQVRTLFGLEG